jgi:hypothetical protein
MSPPGDRSVAHAVGAASGATLSLSRKWVKLPWMRQRSALKVAKNEFASVARPGLAARLGSLRVCVTQGGRTVVTNRSCRLGTAPACDNGSDLRHKTIRCTVMNWVMIENGKPELLVQLKSVSYAKSLSPTSTSILTAHPASKHLAWRLIRSPPTATRVVAAWRAIW